MENFGVGKRWSWRRRKVGPKVEMRLMVGGKELDLEEGAKPSNEVERGHVVRSDGEGGQAPRTSDAEGGQESRCKRWRIGKPRNK